ncbi:MAG TPA: hypothetical protein VK724_03690 [Bryobacteraceae bacterium]|jgi:hypothetical protein|nr:hypothetical protein [Bryobacteraceae bacterium]
MRPRYFGKSVILIAIIAIEAQAASPHKSPSGPVESPKAPEVNFQVQPERDSAQRSHAFGIYVLITNKSSTLLKNPKVILLNPGFGFAEQTLPDVRAFGSAQAEVKLTADAQQEFSAHRLIFLLKYSWASTTGKDFASSQTATATVQVERTFEEEAKGLPVGSVALFYLIIPIVPVFFAYHIADSLRQGQGFTIPEFKAEYLLPSFFVAIVLNLFAVAVLNRDLSSSYSDPRSFGIFLGLSFAAGAVIPALGWGYQKCYWKLYAFRAGDSAQNYLRKALRGSHSSLFQWVTGKYNGQTWEGFLLHQPDQTCVLGAQIEVSTTTPAAGNPSYEELKELENGQKIVDLKKLDQLIKNKSINIAIVRSVKQGTIQMESMVVVLEGLKSFSPDTAVLRSIITFTN